MQKNILLVCLLICFKITYAQNTNFKWVKTFQANKQSIVFTNQFAVDSKNNIYTVGVFEGSVNFAGPFGNFWLSTNKDTNRLGKMNTKDMFITKHDVNGNFIWAKYLGGPNDEYVSSLTIDKFDNVYLAGLYEEEVDFNPDTGRFILSSAIHGNTFILKLDSGGKFIWAKSITSSVGIGIRIDFENNIIGGGFNQGKVDLKPGTDSFIIKKNGSFLFKLDNNGNFIWGKHLEGDILRFSALETDTLGNIYSCGTFMYHRSDFDPGPDSFIMKPTTNVQIYISKLNKFGDFVWAKQVGGQKDNPYYDTDLDIDQHGNVYTYGHFESTCDFDPGAGVYNLVGKLQFDPITHSRFVLKLNSNGNFEWAKKLEIGHHTPGNLIRSDKSGGIYLGGIFSGIIDFDPGLGISNLISTQGFEKASGTYYSSDAFILKLDEWGNYVWSKKIGGPDFDRIYRLFLDKQRNIYGLGIFSDTFSYNIKNRDTIDFNPGGPNGKVYGWGEFYFKI
jgi:hypothetical protein